MPIRLTLVNNAQQTQQAVLLLNLDPPSSTHSRILTAAKNKLRLKTPSKLYNSRGNLLEDSTRFVDQLQNGDSLFVSCEEDFVGAVISSADDPERGRESIHHAIVNVVARRSPIEEQAVKQLERTAKLEGMLMAIGMPDLHPGTSSPIGAAFVCEGHIHPRLIGGDIGCGMALHQTSIPCTVSSATLSRKLHGIEGPLPPTAISDFLAQQSPPVEMIKTDFDDSLGTIGGGNHFAELQRVAEVKDAKTFKGLGMNIENLVLLVHSGSRGYGQHILRSTPSPSLLTSPPNPELDAYLSLHDHALRWALLNRSLIAHRFLDALNATSKLILDIWHNNVERTTMRLPPQNLPSDSDSTTENDLREVWIHRKGAAPSSQGPLVIPGSRGTRSYLVLPTGSQEMNARSVAHGAGRVWDRKKARERGEKRYGGKGKGRAEEELARTELGGEVICEDRELLLEEVPEAYKDVDVVVQDLVEMGLIKIIAIFEPVVTYKTRNE